MDATQSMITLLQVIAQEQFLLECIICNEQDVFFKYLLITLRLVIQQEKKDIIPNI